MENILVKVGRFVFPTDFIILEMEEDDHVPLILGRPFLATARALVDMSDFTLMLRVGDEKIIFGVGERYGAFKDPIQFVDAVDVMLEDEMEKAKRRKERLGCLNDTH